MTRKEDLTAVYITRYVHSHVVIGLSLVIMIFLQGCSMSVACLLVVLLLI